MLDISWTQFAKSNFLRSTQFTDIAEVDPSSIANMQVQNVGLGEKYLAVRRHTVGPGDTAHEQVRSKMLFLIGP